jgi:hypothetical protein
MRSNLVVALIGSLTGALGALAVAGLSSAREHAPHAERAAPLAPPPSGIVPPGWNPLFVAAAAHAEAPPPPSAPAPPATGPARGEPDEKERGRQEHYAQELEYRENELASHDSESVDGAWAHGETATIRQTLSAGERSFVVKSVDCRTRTCVAELTYPTPSEAVNGQASLATSIPAGCHGMLSTLTPPTDAGPYDATVVYYCR